VQVTARIDYALRACAELAAGFGEGPMKSEALSKAQGIPRNYLEAILVDLRRSGLVASLRGADGGYWLKTPPAEVTLADVVRAVDGPLANVRGELPDALEYGGAASHLTPVWVAVRAALRSVLEEITLADLVAGKLPKHVKVLLDDPSAWTSRWS
jgi:Rrf2 family protein